MAANFLLSKLPLDLSLSAVQPGSYVNILIGLMTTIAKHMAILSNVVLMQCPEEVALNHMHLIVVFEL